MIYFRILFAIVNLADAWTTFQLYRFGGYESSYIMKTAIGKLGLFDALMFLKCAVVVVVWWWSFNGLAAWLLALMDAAFGAAVIWNYRQLQLHKKQ